MSVASEMSAQSRLAAGFPGLGCSTLLTGTLRHDQQRAPLRCEAPDTDHHLNAKRLHQRAQGSIACLKQDFALIFGQLIWCSIPAAALAGRTSLSPIPRALSRSMGR